MMDLTDDVKSDALRVTSVKLCTSAVAAMNASIALIGRPTASLCATTVPQALATPPSTGKSRPSKRKAWEYFFFVDIDGHASENNVKLAIEELEKHCTFVKILGTYPKTSPT